MLLLVVVLVFRFVVVVFLLLIIFSVLDISRLTMPCSCGEGAVGAGKKPAKNSKKNKNKKINNKK